MQPAWLCMYELIIIMSASIFEFLCVNLDFSGVYVLG